MIVASAINSIIRSEYLDNELANPPLELKFMLAPRKSTSSLKSSLEIFFVPFPNIADNKSNTPAFSPSTTGLFSILNWYETLGSLLFSTTMTVIPFFNWNSSGFSNEILGSGPGTGICDLSICAFTPKVINATAIKADNFNFNVFILLFIFFR